jgi:macrolide-specific efflux system membrane fusion protein
MRCVLLIVLAVALPLCAIAQEATPGRTSPGEAEPGLQVEEVQLTLIEQVEVPAREAGVLQSVTAREGELVTEGQRLAVIDDAEAQLDKRRAEIELQIAREKAKNDVKVRLSRKSAEVAWAELRRSEESNRQFKGAVSQTEVDRQRLTAEKSDLEIEQAEHEQVLDRLTTMLKENEVAAAVRAVERRHIVAPLAGVVVQVNRRAGEWVEPGESVLRMLRIDRLRAEGFVHADDATADLVGRPVLFTVESPGRPAVQCEGKVTFVSPEINPVNNQVKIWAEIDNPKLSLRPGLQGRLTITRPVEGKSEIRNPKSETISKSERE